MAWEGCDVVGREGGYDVVADRSFLQCLFTLVEDASLA